MELVLSFTCERDISLLEFQIKLSLENFSVKSKNISGFLKSIRRAGRRLITACPLGDIPSCGAGEAGISRWWSQSGSNR
jgi:hypothetical protein